MGDTSFYSGNYYRDRERAERTLADQAASPAIRNIHLEMAERYRELARQLDIHGNGLTPLNNARPKNRATRLANTEPTI